MDLWLVILLMILTVYRTTRLVVKDTLPPVLWLRDRLAGGWRKVTTSEQREISNGAPDDGGVQYVTTEINGVTNRWVHRSDWSPDWLAELITCPWCASGWIAGAVTAGVDLTVGLPVPWLVGPAVWGAGALLASQDWA